MSLVRVCKGGLVSVLGSNVELASAILQLPLPREKSIASDVPYEVSIRLPRITGPGLGRTIGSRDEEGAALAIVVCT